jgi:hypothetical protein
MIVLGGGNAAKLDTLPANARLGSNDNAFIGGFRLWHPAAPPAAGQGVCEPTGLPVREVTEVPAER